MNDERKARRLLHEEREGDAGPLFRGEQYTPELDEPRLKTGLELTIAVMRDGLWRTKTEIAADILLGYAHAVSKESIGRYMRYAREARNGGFTVLKRRRGDAAGGLFEYRFTSPVEVTP